MKRILSLFVIIFVLIGLIGCSAKSEDDYYDRGYYEEFDNNSDKLVINGISGSGDTMMGAPSSNNSGNVPEASLPDSSTTDSKYDSKIIKKYNLKAESTDFKNDLVKIENAIIAVGGYIEGSEVITSSSQGSTPYSRYSIRIPAEAVDVFLSNTSKTLNVISINSTVENVTATYYDLQSRYEVLEAERVSLNSMLERANSVSDMLNIRNYLTDVIQEMESIKTKLEVYDSQAAFSTVKLNVYAVGEYSEDVPEKFGARFIIAIKESWIGFVENLQTFIIWLVYAFPALILIAIFVSISCIIYFKLKKKNTKNTKNTTVASSKTEKAETDETDENTYM